MQLFDTKNQADGAGTLLGEIMFVTGSASRVLAKLSGAGTSTLEFTVDDESTLRVNPNAAGIDWIDAGTGPTSTTPVLVGFTVPITAIRLLPVGAGGMLKVVSVS